MSADLRELLRRMLMIQGMAWQVDLHFGSRGRSIIFFLMFRSAPSNSAIPIRALSRNLSNVIGLLCSWEECDEPYQICEDAAITDIETGV